jgi:hypothetical protein
MLKKVKLKKKVKKRFAVKGKKMLSLPSLTERKGDQQNGKHFLRALKNKRIFFWKKLAKLKRSCTFAPANPETGKVNKEYERHVHRHIGLTANKRE